MESHDPVDRARALAALRGLHDEGGAAMVEYAFLLLGVALVVVVAAETFGISVGDLLLLPMAWL